MACALLTAAAIVAAAARAPAALGRLGGAAGDEMALLQREAKPTEAFADGDEVEIQIQTGPQERTWVPASITKVASKGFYSVHVALGPGDDIQTDIPRVGTALLRRSEDPSARTAALQGYVQDPQAAGRAVKSLERDDLRRRKDALAAKGLNASEVKARMAQVEHLEKAKKEAEMRKKGCPAGYQVRDGEAKSSERLVGNATARQPSVALCAASCEAHDDCRSFQWGGTSTVCSLNKVAEPSKTVRLKDAIFCSRALPSAIQATAAAPPAAPTAAAAAVPASPEAAAPPPPPTAAAAEKEAAAAAPPGTPAVAAPAAVASPGVAAAPPPPQEAPAAPPATPAVVAPAAVASPGAPPPPPPATAAAEEKKIAAEPSVDGTTTGTIEAHA